MNRGAMEKIIVPGRYVNEVDGGDVVSDESVGKEYYNQIICVVK